MIIRVSGHYDIIDITRAFDGVVTNPLFEPGLSLLLDWRDSLEMPPTAVLPSHWASLASVKSLFSPSAAFVATNRADLERGRMFAIYAATQGFMLEVFTDIDEATGWLRSRKDSDPCVGTR